MVYNAEYIHDNMAITFAAADWLSVSPGGGTIDPFGSAVLNVGFSPGELELGYYTGMLTVNCNDPDSPQWQVPVSMTVVSPFMCGDLNDDDEVDILDILYLINFKYKEGPAPDPMASGDVNSDSDVNLLDIVYLIQFKYKDGPAPDCP